MCVASSALISSRSPAGLQKASKSEASSDFTRVAALFGCSSVEISPDYTAASKVQSCLTKLGSLCSLTIFCRVAHAIEALHGLCMEFPNENITEDMLAKLNLIRAKHKAITSMLGLSLVFDKRRREVQKDLSF